MERILFADDQEDEHTIWKRFHAELESEVARAFRGRCGLDTVFTFEDAMKSLEEREYDILLLDLVIPPGGYKQGIEFIAKNHNKIPIIAFTGHEDIFIRRSCIIAGAVDFWTKRDAQRAPDLFFKCVYNQYVKKYVPPA